ncbi:SUMF1/EgtB/PvdO family nonheme iron enzyme [Vibrio scophthalmi]|uniref:Sulfatase-modifying factor enzyme-like domain-containing protein n=1 Tax=Vibrio scophthalmi TaxID=45658 RepID=A0A1C7FEX2_9VIBR|nr:SUMF1/EgtB/PvdO family nonheme iron enzyme [Vibrio scophthalmi]ANU38492.1 hypothetical protein VSVS05_03454 [Vibrio scophthalmi]
MNKNLSISMKVIIYIGLFFISYSHASDEVKLTLPDNVILKFQPIYLGLDGEQVFTSKRVKLGSRQSDDVSYKERLSTTNLGGSFIGYNNKGKKDWLYYLGETEVSRQQWNTVMRWWQKEKGLELDDIDNSLLPQTQKTPAEIFTFIEALNIWALKNAKKDLPKNGNALAYFRLPTEVEWAFAARGGIEVPDDVFDRPYPYIDKNGHMMLGGYEWYRASSGKKVKEVGSQHLQPNPVGLYDMLGNVEELTYGIFGHDFLFARFGGLVIRGGNFSTDQRDMKVSKRTEYDGYTPTGDAIRLSKVGFRLALGTLVSETGHSNEELDEGYDNYLSSDGGVSQPSAAGNTSLGQQAEDDQIHWYREERKRLLDENNALQQENEEISSNVIALKGNVSLHESTLTDVQKKLAGELLKNSELTKLVNAKANDQDLQMHLKSKEDEITKLQSEVERLQSVVNDQMPKIVRAEDSNRKILQLQQNLDDAKRRDITIDFEIDKNKQRVVVAEKRLLEALVRVAGYNLYSAWRNLKSIEIKKKKLPSGKSMNPSVWKVNQIEAENMLMEYRRYVIQIADNTDTRLLPEVKSELVSWLQDNKFSVDQINGLNLLERHVEEVKSGKYLQVSELYKSLLTEPEMRK